MSRAEMLAARLPSAETPADEPLREAAAPRTWKVGDRARSGSGRLGGADRGAGEGAVAARRSKRADCASLWKSMTCSRPSACRRPSARGTGRGGRHCRGFERGIPPASRRRGASRPRWICAARGSRRPSRRSIATWTMPVSPDSGRRRSSTGSARARCAMPFGRLPRHTHWSVPSGPVSAERAATGRRVVTL
jgi:hypothetical protein